MAAETPPSVQQRLLQRVHRRRSERPRTSGRLWQRALAAEIAAQEALIDAMDFPPNPEMWGDGIMTQIRAQRLDALRALLPFEPEVPTDQAGATSPLEAAAILFVELVQTGKSPYEMSNSPDGKLTPWGALVAAVRDRNPVPEVPLASLKPNTAGC